MSGVEQKEERCQYIENDEAGTILRCVDELDHKGTHTYLDHFDTEPVTSYATLAIVLVKVPQATVVCPSCKKQGDCRVTAVVKLLAAGRAYQERCDQCGQRMLIRKSLLAKHNTTPNRHQRRARGKN